MNNEGIHILLVDDDFEARDVYASFFRNAGFLVDEAENGLEALERIQTIKPDIIISGVVMPKMDGFALVQALRQNTEMSQVPVIFLSHLGHQEDERRLKELGVSDFIMRGTTPLKEVLSRVKAALSVVEYVLAIDPESFDARRFASDMGIPEDFSSPDGVNGRYVLRLRLVDAARRRFGAEIISA